VKMNDDDIIQIIPATGWYAEFEDKNGTWRCPLVAWALESGGGVHSLYTDSDGDVLDPTLVSNFVRIVHEYELAQETEGAE